MPKYRYSTETEPNHEGPRIVWGHSFEPDESVEVDDPKLAKKLEQLGCFIKEPEAAPEPPKKKRGRPKKVVVDSEEES